jgi:hypothetical protein
VIGFIGVLVGAVTTIIGNILLHHKQAIRDLNQWAMIIVSNKKKHSDTRNDRKELEEKYQAFIKELENV